MDAWIVGSTATGWLSKRNSPSVAFTRDRAAGGAPHR